MPGLQTRHSRSTSKKGNFSECRVWQTRHSRSTSKKGNFSECRVCRPGIRARLSERLSLLQKAYVACTDAVDSPSFRATVLRWLDEEELHDNDGKSILATGHGDCDSMLLHWAAMKGDLVVVEALLRHGADRQQRSNGMTPADIARACVLELVYSQPLALRKNVHQSWPLALNKKDTSKKN